MGYVWLVCWGFPGHPTGETVSQRKRADVRGEVGTENAVLMAAAFDFNVAVMEARKIGLRVTLELTDTHYGELLSVRLGDLRKWVPRAPRVKT